MRSIRVRQKMRVVTDEDLLREAFFQQDLEDLKYFAELRMAEYDSMPREDRDWYKEND